jgi:hypothetical protein
VPNHFRYIFQRHIVSQRNHRAERVLAGMSREIFLNSVTISDLQCNSWTLFHVDKIVRDLARGNGLILQKKWNFVEKKNP